MEPDAEVLMQMSEINRLLLGAQKKGFEFAVEKAIRTGTSLVLNKNGKIRKVKPKYKYILVSTEKGKKKKPVTIKQVTRELIQENA